MSEQQENHPEIAADFDRWCREHRHVIGRDRLKIAFEAGWALGYATAVDEQNETQEQTT